MSQAGTYVKSGITPITPIETLTGDIGGPIGPDALNNINVIADHTALNCGSSVLISGNPATNTLTLQVTDVNNNTIVGSDAGNLTLSGSQNTSLGYLTLSTITSGSFNTAIGYTSLSSINTGVSNTALGNGAGNVITSSNQNTAIGAGSLASHTTGTGRNTALGFDSLLQLTTGHDNTAIGYQSGINYVGAEVGNISINNPGLAAESFITRIGNQGTQLGCFIAGITGVTPSNPQTVGIDSVTGQLGVIAGSGPSIETITGNTGGPESPDGSGNFNFLTSNTTVKFAGSANTETLNFGITNLVLGSALPSLAGGTGNVGLGNAVLASVTSASNNTVIGYQAGNAITSSAANILIGYQSGLLLATGSGANIAIGSSSLSSTTSGTTNYAIGTGALSSLTTGQSNIIVGASLFSALTTGSYNTAISSSSGTNSGSDSSNAYFANPGTGGDNNVLRVGNQGAGNGQQNKCFIAGIVGVTVSNPQTVVINSATGQLGIGAGSGPAVESFKGNDGVQEFPDGSGIFNIVTANSTVKFLGSANTETLNFGITNLVLGSALPSLAGGTGNIGLGNNVLNAITSGINNIAIGAGVIGGTEAGIAMTSGSNNIAIGVSALYQSTTAYSNIAIGYTALSAVITTAHDNICIGGAAGASITTGTNNCTIGSSAAGGLLTGNFNTAIGGNGPGAAWTTSESSNIAIGSNGVIGESNTIRIGNPGSGNNQQNRCFIAGIDGVNLTTANVVTESSNQLGSATITAGTGISISTATPNQIIISATGTSTFAYRGVSTTPYVVDLISPDDVLGVDTSVLAITIQLPNAPVTGRSYVIKDATGNANTNNITVTTVGGAVNIDGATTFVMNTSFESVTVVFTGSAYLII